MIKEIKNAWWDYWSVLSSQIITIPFSITYISFITRRLGPDRWGDVALFMSLVQFVFCLSISWTSSSIVRFGKEEFMKEGHLRKTFSARLVLLLITMVCFLFPLYFLRGSIINYVGFSEQIFSFLILMLLTYAFADFLAWILKAIGLMRQFAISSLLRQLALLFFFAVVVLKSDAFSVQTVIVFEILSYAAVSVFCIIFLKRKYFFPLKMDLVHSKNILIYSWPLIFGFLLGYASDWMDVYFIRHYLSSYHIGIYQVAYRMMLYINTPLMAITTLMFPLLMALKTQGRNDLVSIYIKRLIPQVSFLWSIVVLILMAMVDSIITVVFGHSFIEAAMPLMILLIGVGFQSVGVMYTSIFAVFDWLKYTVFITIIMCLVNILGNVILIPRIGISGASIATAISYVLSWILYLIIANRLILIKTYKALYYPISTVVSFLFCLYVKELSLRMLFLGCIISVFIFVAKLSRLFSGDDIVLLEKIEMPNFIKNGVRRIYTNLA